MHPSACSPPDLPAWRRTPSDELINAATHALGFLLAAAGARGDGFRPPRTRDAALGVGCAVYLASLMAVFAMSTLSHCAASPRWKSFFRRLDQGCIYLLIVSTYTPFSLFYLRDAAWSLLLAAMWVVAISRFCRQSVFRAPRRGGLGFSHISIRLDARHRAAGVLRMHPRGCGRCSSAACAIRRARFS